MLRISLVSAKLETCLNLLGAMAVELKDVKQRVVSGDRGTSNITHSEIALKIKKLLPIQTQTEASEFDLTIQCPDHHEAFVS